MAELRPLTINDLDHCLELSAAEGWNQVAADWLLLISSPGNVCLGIEENSRIIATATVMNYKNLTGWVAMVLVDKEHRGKGYARMMLDRLFEKTACCRSLKLDATPAGEPVYRKMGFIKEYMIYRMTREPLGVYLNDTGFNPEVLSVNPNVLVELATFDAEVFGADRQQLISHLLSRSPEQSMMYVKNGKIRGMVTGRLGRRFFQCGPLPADNPGTAQELVSAALLRHTSQPVVVDVPEYQEDLILWFEQAGFIRQRHFIRMYRHHNSYPGIAGNQYLICGPEFG